MPAKHGILVKREFLDLEVLDSLYKKEFGIKRLEEVRTDTSLTIGIKHLAVADLLQVGMPTLIQEVSGSISSHSSLFFDHFNYYPLRFLSEVMQVLVIKIFKIHARIEHIPY